MYYFLLRNEQNYIKNKLIYKYIYNRLSRLNNYRFVKTRETVLAAEPPAWAPPAGSKWEEKDYSTELVKLEKEAEQRLDAKIAEMMGKIDTTGVKK